MSKPVHGGQPLPPHVTFMRFGCPLCPGRFPTMGAKRAHLRDTHPEERNAKRAR